MNHPFDHLAHQQHLNLHQTRVESLRQTHADIQARIAEHDARPLLKKLFGEKTDLDDAAFRTKLLGDAVKKLTFAESELKRAEEDFQAAMHRHLAQTGDRYKRFIQARDLYASLMEQASRYAEHTRNLLRAVGVARNMMAVSSHAASNTYSDAARNALADWLAAYAPVHESEKRLRQTLDTYNELVRGTPFSSVRMPAIRSVSARPAIEIGGIGYAEKRALLERQKEMLDTIVPELPGLYEAIKAAAEDFEKALRDYRRKRHDEALRHFAQG